MIPSRSIQTFDPHNTRTLSPAARRIADLWVAAIATRMAEALADFGVPAKIKPDMMLFKATGVALAGLNDPDVAAVFVVGTANFRTIISMRPGTLLALLHSMLGPELTEAPADRALSPVEHSLSAMFFERLRQEVSEGWPQRDPLPVIYQRTVTRSARARLFDPNDVLMVCTLNLETSRGTEIVRFLAPMYEVEQLCQPGSATAAPREVNQGRIADLMPSIPMNLSVELGRVQLSVTETESLKCGDVLVLDRNIRDRLTASIAGQPKYRGRAGRVGARLCFAIEGLAEE